MRTSVRPPWAPRSTFFWLAVTAASTVACSDSGESTTLADTVETIALPPRPSAVVETAETTDQSLDIPNAFVCDTVEVDATGASGDYRTFDPNSDVIWPGNILQGATISQGTPEVVDVERAGGTFTIDLVNGSGATQVSVADVTQGNVIQAINDIIMANTGVLPANFNYTFREVRSREELALAMRVSVDTFTTDFEAEISARTSNEFHSVLVDFVQQYYTISYETPTSYEGFFEEGVTGADLAPYVGPGNPPVFIKSVTYGRRYYLMITARASSAEIEASITASYDAALSSTDLDVDATYVKDLQDVEISVFAMGGDSESAAASFRGDFDAVQQFLTTGGAIDTGKPLSYKLETVAEPHQDVGIGVATEFTVTDCQPVALPPFAEGWFGVFDGTGIGSAVATEADGDNVLLFNRAGTEYAQIVGGQVQDVFTLGDPDDTGRLAGCPISPAGAAQGLNDQIRIFSQDGLSYVWQLPGTLEWGEVRDLSLWGIDGTHPFLDANGGAEAGVGVAFQSRVGPDAHSIHFNKAGNRWISAINESFSELRTLDDWGGPNYDLPFASIGAGLRVQYQGQRYEVLFNATGTRFVVFPPQIAGQRNFSGVYQIGLDPE